MKNPFRPEFQGELELPSVPDDFVARIQRRVERGLIRPGTRRRANYSIRSAGRDEIAFGSADFLTSYSIGLNEVQVRRSGWNSLRYRVTFWRWTRTAVVHGLVLGLALLICVAAIPEARHQVNSYPLGAGLFGAFVLFWSLLWPWLLTAVHRRFAERELQRILKETVA